jgi:hypothetical protein
MDNQLIMHEELAFFEMHIIAASNDDLFLDRIIPVVI